MSDHVLYQVDVVNSKKRKTFSKWTGTLLLPTLLLLPLLLCSI